jgi:hypothetical protein
MWQATALEGMLKELDKMIIEEKLDEKLRERARIIAKCQQDSVTMAW